MNDPLVLERWIAAPAAVVYSYLTESDKWSRWQGETATIEPKRGGIFALTMPSGVRARGQFLELVPNQRVVFTWGWVDHPGVPPGSTTVEIDLVHDGEGTLLRLTHHGLPADEVATHNTGWMHYLGRLGIVARGEEPGPDPGPG